MIRAFWAASGKNPSTKFFPSPTGGHRCDVCCREFSTAAGLKVHKRTKGHHDSKTRKTTNTAVADAKLLKRKAEQQQLPKVMWGEREAANAWHTKYLGSVFEAGGGQTHDIKTRIAMARQRFDKLRHMGG